MTTYRITHTITTDAYLDANSDPVTDMRVQIESIPDARVDSVTVEEVELWDVEGTPEHAAAHGEPDHELDGEEEIDGILIPAVGPATRVRFRDTLEGVAELLEAGDCDTLCEDSVRVFYDVNGATLDRPANVRGTALAQRLGALQVWDVDYSLVGPLLIAEGRTIGSSTMETICEILPEIDFAGRW